MQLLKAMDISGYLYPAYGKLTVQYTFENTASAPCAPRYFFPLPEESTICGFQLLTRDKTILRGHFSAITDPCETPEDFRLVKIKPGLFCLTFEELLPGETCTILLDVLLSLFSYGDFCRFTFPNYPGTPISVNVTLHGMTPQKNKDVHLFDTTEKTFSGSFSGNQDLVLDCNITDKTSVAVLEESFGGGLGFYRLYTNPSPATLPKAITLLWDWSNLSSVAQINQMKELIFRLFSLIPKDVPVNIPALWKKAIFVNEKTRQELFTRLQPSDSAFLFENPVSAEADTVTVFISANIPFPLPQTSEKTVFLTVGNHCPLNFTGCSRHFHCYPDDICEDRLTQLLSSLLSYQEDSEPVPEGSNVREVFVFPHTAWGKTDYIDLVLSYTGQAPHSFHLYKNRKIAETVILEKLNKMPHYPDAKQLFALGKSKHLHHLLTKVSPASFRALKKELTECSVRYQILDSETILALDAGLDAPFHLPVYCTEALSRTAFPTETPTIFGESLRNLSRNKNLKEFCLDILYGNIRENGGIFSFDTISAKSRGEETALAAMGLLLHANDTAILHEAYGFLDTVSDNQYYFFLRAIRDGKPMMAELLKLLPTPEELFSRLEEHPYSVKYAAMVLLWLYQ